MRLILNGLHQIPQDWMHENYFTHTDTQGKWVSVVEICWVSQRNSPQWSIYTSKLVFKSNKIRVIIIIIIIMKY